MSYHARRFDRAAGSYAAHAAFQGGMAQRLLSLLPADAPGGPILELGCGTGLLTALLASRYPGIPFLATDAAPRMAAAAEAALGNLPGMRFEVCDAAGASPAPPAVDAAGPFRLAASNAVVQWFPDLALHLRWIASRLFPGGLYLVSGFDRGNFPELNAILREPPFAYPDFPGHPAADLPGLAAAGGMEVLAAETEARETTAPSARAFLEAIRALGAARRPREDRPLTRARLALLLERYHARYPREGGVAATWKPWYALLRKRG